MREGTSRPGSFVAWTSHHNFKAPTPAAMGAASAINVSASPSESSTKSEPSMTSPCKRHRRLRSFGRSGIKAGGMAWTRPRRRSCSSSSTAQCRSISLRRSATKKAKVGFCAIQGSMELCHTGKSFSCMSSAKSRTIRTLAFLFLCPNSLIKASCIFFTPCDRPQFKPNVSIAVMASTDGSWYSSGSSSVQSSVASQLWPLDSANSTCTVLVPKRPWPALPTSHPLTPDVTTDGVSPANVNSRSSPSSGLATWSCHAHLPSTLAFSHSVDSSTAGGVARPPDPPRSLGEKK
mmetsp:Transcript_80446/g.236645  ORF Transcript_80446/g.236645 Transcript_80446/m.236645 type:complete len:291 (+) Transcript_80446:1595-2467(+)